MPEASISIDATYAVVYPSGNASARDAASQVLYQLRQQSGLSLSLQNDTKTTQECEILIGPTRRQESLTAKDLMGEKDLIVTVVGKKLVIYASADSHYATAVKYLIQLLSVNKEFSLPADLCYVKQCDDISTFVMEEKVGKGKTCVDITLDASSSTAKAGIFIGDTKKGQGSIGYNGYCLIASNDALSLMDTRTNKTTELASRFIDGLANGKEIRLRLEIDGTVCRGYLLDDLPDVDPWPEFELPIQDCEGYNIGYVSLTATPCNYRNLSVTYGDKTEFSGKTYTNDVYANYPDPDVLFYDGTYYLYGTGGEGGYRVHSSTDLVNWTDRGVAAPFGMWGISKNYWAPDVEYIDGLFYMVASCNENLGIAISSSPLGPFEPITEAVLYQRAIDGHLFVDDDGRIYLYYVNIGTNSGIYGVELNSSMTPLGEPKRLLYPTEAWEMHDGRVTEGPYMLKHNGSYYLTYSGSDYQSHDYAVGYAMSPSPLGSYQKYALNPIMIGNSAISGTAHHCIIPLPDREEMLIIYHCHESLTQIHDRDICIDLIRFAPTQNGADRLEVYGPTVTPRPYPLDKS